MNFPMHHRPERDTDDFEPGDWTWYTATGRERAGIICMLPTGDLAAISGDRWKITGDESTGLTATPSIHHAAGKPNEWHGYITAGQFVPC